jgi:hypothetical protein
MVGAANLAFLIKLRIIKVFAKKRTELEQG